MVATAPGEKLLIGHRPVRNWTQLQFFFFVSTKTAATRAALFDSNMHQSLVGWGFPLGELTALPQTFQLHLRGLLLKRGEERGEEGRGGETRRGKGKREFVICPRKNEKSAPMLDDVISREVASQMRRLQRESDRKSSTTSENEVQPNKPRRRVCVCVRVKSANACRCRG